MDGIFFLILAFITAFLSIKLSYYGDKLSKQTKLSSVLIGGLLIASITSLPEFVTSISAVLINNPSLSYGDILGSNMFNIFVLAIYNIYFFKKDIFKNTSEKYKYETLILIIEYLSILLTSLTNINFTTFILIIMYIFYIIKLTNNKNEEINSCEKIKYLYLKFIICALLLILLSILLTIEADKLCKIYPKFSSSTIGAILLGITTSLPEVVSTFALLKYNNYNMAISNMLGSNIFNFLVLAISDIILKNKTIYLETDIYINLYIYGGIFITLLFLMCLLIKNKSKLFYFSLSILMSLSYLLVWYFQFQ